MKLAPFGAGEPVKLDCQLGVDGVAVDRSIQFILYRTLTARSETALTVLSPDGTDFTCDVPPGLDLSAFPVGTQVKLHCHRLDGTLRLGFIKSEQAVVEVPH